MLKVLHRPDEASPHMLNVLDIHVVVGDPVVCKSLQQLLETGNFRCHCFTSVTTLLEHMSQLMDGCILLDDDTSALDGLELLARIRQAKGSFPLVLMTTQADVGFAANARKVGIANLIEKPFSDDALFAAIHSVLLGKSAMDVLAVIQNEAGATGECCHSVAQIAERAHLGRAKTRAAIKLAESLGVIAREDASKRKRIVVSRVLTPLP
jgi:FixJ family two-component response regulator